MRRLLIPCLLAAGTFAAVVPPALAQGDAMDHCMAAGAAYEAAIDSGDPAKVAAQFTVDGVLTAPEGIFHGPHAIAAYAGAFVKPGVTDVDTFKTARMVGGDVVVCSGGYSLTFAPGSPMKEATGTWTKVVARSRHEWRLEQLTFSYAPPPMPPQSQQESRAR